MQVWPLQDLVTMRRASRRGMRAVRGRLSGGDGEGEGLREGEGEG